MKGTNIDDVLSVAVLYEVPALIEASIDFLNEDSEWGDIQRIHHHMTKLGIDTKPLLEVRPAFETATAHSLIDDQLSTHL